MTAQQLIYAALKDLVSGRCYQDTFLQPDGTLPSWPSIRFSVVGGDAHTDLSGNDESQETPVIQIDVVGKTTAARQTLVSNVRLALADVSPVVTIESTPALGYDTETKTYTATLTCRVAL